MSGSNAIGALINLLIDINERQLSPDQATNVLAEASANRLLEPPLLIWFKDNLSSRYHYTTLLECQPGTTISVGVCRDLALPWTLFGAHHFHEADVVTVDGRKLSVGRAWSHIVLSSLIPSALPKSLAHILIVEIFADRIRQAITANEISEYRSLAERRAQSDRREPLSLEHWRAARGLGEIALEQVFHWLARQRLLRRYIVGDDVEGHFNRDPSRYDEAWILRMPCQRGIQFREGENVAHQLVEIGSVWQSGEELVPTTIRCYRKDLSPGEAVRVFSAPVGQAVGPFGEGSPQPWLTMVLRTAAAQLSSTTYNAIADELFADWLERETKNANIQWYWGEPAPFELGT